jgi:CelD/BcsL family acetyltransferase involved in cellulose biosynthesis
MFRSSPLHLDAFRNGEYNKGVSTMSYEIEIVSSPERFAALEPEWNALWQGAASPYFSQSFLWCLTGWQTTAKPRGRTLHIVVVRLNGRAVLIWPMTLRRRHFWRIATALGSESTEYCPILVEDTADKGAHLRAAWTHLRQSSGIDVIAVPSVRDGCEMQHVLRSDAAHSKTEILPSPFVSWQGIHHWDDYLRSRRTNLRSELNRRRRRLSELGTVTIGPVHGKQEQTDTIRWILRNKSDWMAASGLTNNFLRTREFRDFLESLSRLPGTVPHLQLFVLKLDDRIIAAKLGAVDGTRYEGFISTFDNSFATYSPGQILLTETLKWCHERGLDYDFRIGTESYKRDWANSDRPVTTYTVANTAWGAILLVVERILHAGRKTRDRLRDAIPVWLRRQVKKAWKMPNRNKARVSFVSAEAAHSV